MYDRRAFINKVGRESITRFLSDTPVVIPKIASNRDSKDEPESIYTDIIVIGAGVSGVPAAIAAARMGMKVILIEQDMQPGGAPVNMYVTMPCGGPREGIYKEMISKLNADYSISGNPHVDFGDTGLNGKTNWFLPESYLFVIHQMIAAEPNITLMCGTKVIGVEIDLVGERKVIKGVDVVRNMCRQIIYGKKTIDATGTGYVAEMCGAQLMYGREGKTVYGEMLATDVTDNKIQPCTWMFISQRLKPNANLPFRQLKSKAIVEDDYNHWVTEKDVSRNAGIYLHWGVTLECGDSRDTFKISEMQDRCLKILNEDIRLLAEAGFQVYLAPKVGIRESNRVRGEYILTLNDIQSGRIHEDSIVNCECDFHSTYGMSSANQNAKYSFGVPYRCLIPLQIEDLLVTGKAISGTHLALKSYRFQPVVACIGQAAGVAVGLAVQNSTTLRSLDMSLLQAKLRDQGITL